MKKLLTDRRFAAAVLAVVVLVFTPLGAGMSLRRAVRNVEEQFFTGVDGRGAIADYLSDSANAALGLVTVGAGYDAAAEETGALRAARSALLDVMDGRDVSAYAEVNFRLVQSFRALRDVLLAVPLTEEDARSLELYVSAFEGAQGAVNRAGYNEAVEDFTENTLGRFPAGLISGLLGVDPPKKFQ